MYLTDNSFAGDFSLLPAVFFISRQNFRAGSDFGEEILKGIVQLICQDNSKKQRYDRLATTLMKAAFFIPVIRV